METAMHAAAVIAAWLYLGPNFDLCCFRSFLSGLGLFSECFPYFGVLPAFVKSGSWDLLLTKREWFLAFVPCSHVSSSVYFFFTTFFAMFTSGHLGHGGGLHA